MDIFHNWFGIGWTRLSNKSYKIECLYFWQNVCDSLPPLPLSKNHFFLIFWNEVDLPPSLLDNVFKYTGFFLEITPLGKNRISNISMLEIGLKKLTCFCGISSIFIQDISFYNIHNPNIKSASVQSILVLKQILKAYPRFNLKNCNFDNNAHSVRLQLSFYKDYWICWSKC